jgi:phospholipid/cholesterol/gamma-HCH transport system ATP-binding protein
MIRFENISKAFGPKVVLDDVTLQVETGRIRFIVGASGAGKSVLVKQLIGLLRPDGGRIYLDGEDITDLTEREMYRVRKKCAMVFQHSTLFDSMTLLENVALPLRKHRKLTRQEALDQALPRLEQVDMHREAQRYPADIGDGLRKRVAIARALTMDPEYVIFDEPTTALDPLAAANVDKLIKQLSVEFNVTSIVVSHDLRSIFTVADRIAMLYKGRVLLDGRPDDFRSTQDPIVRQFIEGRAEGPMEFPRAGS